MKTLLSVITSLLLFALAVGQSVGIGTATPAASAQLEVSSTTRGLLAPRMTTAQRIAIASPAKGLLVYDNDLNALYHYNGSGWAAVGGSGGFALPFEGSVNTGVPGIKVTNSGAGPAIHAITTNEFGFALQASNSTNYGYSLYAYSRSPNAIGVYAFVDSSTGVKATSAKGIGLHAISTDSMAIRAQILNGPNTDPVILATHAGVGMALDASSVSGTAIRGISASSVGVRGESTTGTGVLGYSNNNVGVSAGTLGGTALTASAVGGTALAGSSSSGYALDVSGKVQISGGNTNPAAGAVLTSLDANGNAVWKNNNYAFSVRKTNPNLLAIPASTNHTIHLFEEEFDYGNRYASYTGSTPAFGNSVYNPVVSGVYHFSAALALDGEYGEDAVTIAFPELRLVAIRGGNRVILTYSEFSPFIRNSFNSYTVQASFSKDVRLLAGDIVFLEVNHSSAGTIHLWVYGAEPFFSGHLVLAE